MKNKTILICDDDTDMGEELAEFFEHKGWSVHLFNDPVEARAFLASGAAPDCLLTDVCMPALDGTGLIRYARNLPEEHRPRVMSAMTGQPNLGFPHALADLPHCYSKPLDHEQLVEDLTRKVLLARP